MCPNLSIEFRPLIQGNPGAARLKCGMGKKISKNRAAEPLVHIPTLKRNIRQCIDEMDLTDEEARWKILREGAIPAEEISEFFAQG